jgi:ribosomal protein S18 acetylase RimI-like enzyme
VSSAPRTSETWRAYARKFLVASRVDVIEWRSTEKIPQPPQVPNAAIHRVFSPEPGEWRDLLPRRRRKTIKPFLARGDQGYLATISGQFAGWIWLSRVSHRDPASGLHIRLAPDEAYSYAMWVDSAYRDLGIAGVLVSTMLSDIQKGPPISRVYGWVDPRNRESQVLLRMVFGFTQVQQVRRIHLVRRGWQVPRSDHPRFGPVSRVGRHSTGSPGPA